MARIKLEIDATTFQQVVNDLEGKQTFRNPSYLWKAVEASEWAKGLSPRPLTAAVAYQRAKELNIVCKTTPGKRGPGVLTDAHKASMQAGRTGRKPRASKMANYPQTFKLLRQDVPVRFLPLVDAAETGSLRAALKLNCLRCVGYSTPEVRKCSCLDCPWYPHRPYQGTATEGEADPEVAEVGAA